MINIYERYVEVHLRSVEYRDLTVVAADARCNATANRRPLRTATLNVLRH